MDVFEDNQVISMVCWSEKNQKITKFPSLLMEIEKILKKEMQIEKELMNIETVFEEWLK